MTRKIYAATCHCGAVRVELPGRPRRLLDCNCSLCRRYGTRWCYTRRSALRVSAKRGDLEAYRWGAARIDFKRCRRCGCVMFWEDRKPDRHGVARVGVNTRMMDPEDLAGIRVVTFDGASL